MKNKKRITMSLDPEVWERVQDEATRRNMSASGLAEVMLKAGLERLEAESATLWNILADD